MLTSVGRATLLISLFFAQPHGIILAGIVISSRAYAAAPSNKEQQAAAPDKAPKYFQEIYPLPQVCLTAEPVS